MKNQTLLLGLLCFAMVGLGCDEEASRGPSPMGNTGGTSPMGTPPGDTPPAPPAPPAMTDAGAMQPPPAPPTTPPTSACTVDVTSGLPELPSACLPRCSAATFAAVRGCADGNCQRSAMEGDTTPSTLLTMTANGEEVDSADLGCYMCFNLMNNSCVSQICSAQMQAFVACRGMGGSCEAEDNAIGMCLMANESAYRSCQGERVPLCFSPS